MRPMKTKPPAKPAYQSVAVPIAQANALRAYRKETGVSVTVALGQAIDQFLATKGVKK